MGPSLPQGAAMANSFRWRRRSVSSEGAKGGSSTLSSALTEERLREFNVSRISPYYKGLTDYSLALRDLSPGRETYATASTGARSFSSTVLLRFHEWGTSCFTRRGPDLDDDGQGAGGERAPAAGGRLLGSLPGGGAGGSREKRLDVPPSREAFLAAAAAAATVGAQPSRERVLAEAAAGNVADLHGGRKPLRESRSAPEIAILEPWKDEKASRGGRPAEAVGPPPTSPPPPAPPQAREVHEPGASSASGSSPAPAEAVGSPPTSPPPPAPPQAREVHDPGASSASGSSPAPAPVTPATGGGRKERVFVWADIYRPKTLEDFICNRAAVMRLRDMASKGECDHFIFEGPPGVGKKTMISALLREVYGPERSQTKDEVKEFALKEEVIPNIQAKVKISTQHIEINLSELRGYEKPVVAALIKEVSRSTSKDNMPCHRTNCQAIVLYDADKLSMDSQHYICWLMERHRACFKIIFCSSDASKLQPVQHLCKVVKLQPPSNSEIVNVLEFIAKNEGIDLPYNLAKKIADNSKQNLRQAIRSFEASWQSSYPFKENQEILTGWEEDITNIAKNIVEEQSPRQLYSIREKLKNLIEHNVSPHFIFNTLQVELKKLLDGDYHTKLDDLCEEYKNDIRGCADSEKSSVHPQDVQDNTGRRNHDMRSFMTIEEFTAKFMSCYKSSVVKNVRGKNGCSS